MSATQLLDRDGAAVWHATWAELAMVVERCDLLCVDAPYSERTHAGHNNKTASVNGAVASKHVRDNRERQRLGLPPMRRSLNYASWDTDDVSEFVSTWAPRTSGWFVSITDDVLAPAWSASLERSGRYVFAPLAFVEPGSRVRLSGDGPSNWTTWIVVARPRSRHFARWGTLPGAYVTPIGFGDGRSRDIVGGKPTWLLERLCEHYSRPGDLVVDPCCGAGTTGTAAVRTGRRFIGGDAMAEHAALAARNLGGMLQQPLFVEGWVAQS